MSYFTLMPSIPGSPSSPYKWRRQYFRRLHIQSIEGSAPISPSGPLDLALRSDPACLWFLPHLLYPLKTHFIQSHALRALRYHGGRQSHGFFPNTLTPGGPSSPFSPLSPSKPGGPRSPWSKTVANFKILKVHLSNMDSENTSSQVFWHQRASARHQDWSFSPISLLYLLDFPLVNIGKQSE